MASCKRYRTTGRWKFASLAILLAGLYGCATLEDDVGRTYASGVKMKDVDLTITTADARIVMHRKRLGSDDYVVCTEPPPDTAKAIQAVLALEGKGGDGTVTAGASMSSGASEAVLELAGRSTALLGLRDGLYRACEAYANGALGADAYALLETRYGQLMTTLFLGQDIAGVASNHANTVSAPTINISAPNNAVQSTTNTGSDTGAGQAGDSQPAKTATAAGGATAGSGGSKPAGAAPNSGGAADSGASGGPSPGSTSGSGSTSNASSSSTSAVAAVALARMNEDYFNLDLNPALNLATVCINAGDTTRTANTRSGTAPLSSVGGAGNNDDMSTIGNPYLKSLCGALTLEQLGKSQQIAMDFNKSVRPLNPADVAGSPPKSPDIPAPASAAATSWTVSFKTGSTLDDAAKAVIAAAIAAIKQNAKALVIVEGRTDPTGSDAENLKTAQARAKIVADALKATLPNTVNTTATISTGSAKPAKADPSQRIVVISVTKPS